MSITQALVAYIVQKPPLKNKTKQFCNRTHVKLNTGLLGTTGVYRKDPIFYFNNSL